MERMRDTLRPVLVKILDATEADCRSHYLAMPSSIREIAELKVF